MNKIYINNDIKEFEYPYISIKVNGKIFDYPESVFSIAAKREYNGISKLELHLKNKLGIFEEVIMSELGIFTPNSAIEVWMGEWIGKETYCAFKGTIIKLSTNENDENLSIEAKHVAEEMTKIRKLRSFKEKSYIDIIKDICSEYNIEPSIDEDSVVPPQDPPQYNVTDWDFINILAETIGLMVFTTPEGISVRKPDFQKDAIKISNEDIKKIEINNDSRKSPKNYIVQAWNYTEQEPDGESPESTDSAKDLKVLSMSSQEDSRMMEIYQKALSMRNDLAFLRGKLTIFGRAPILPNDVLDIEAVKKKFGKNVIVSSVLQVISSEEAEATEETKKMVEMDQWETLIEFGYDDTAYLNRFDDVVANPSMGTIPCTNGLQIAKVEGIENDPQEQGRICIRLANSLDTKMWARLATLDAGDGRGTFFMPEIGDEVVVGFVDDNPGQAVVLGMLHSGKAKTPFEQSEENNIKGYVSRGKIIVQFDDEKKSLLIETPGGNKVLISDEDKGISMEDQNGNTLVLNDQGITMESQKKITIKASQDVVIEGSNVNIKANAQLKIDGTTGAELSAKGNTVVKGAMVQIN